MPTKEMSLLKKIDGGIIIPATDEIFVAAENLKVNTRHDAPVKISHIWDYFCELYLGKIEKPKGERAINYFELKQSSVDDPIIAELGGEESSRMYLYDMFWIMKGQRMCEEIGPLLTSSGSANVFFIPDINDVIRSVGLFRFSGGWGLDAYNEFDSLKLKWRKGFRVFSPATIYIN
jgi:hypothetical protein